MRRDLRRADARESLRVAAEFKAITEVAEEEAADGGRSKGASEV